MDESVPFTKATLDDLLGITSTEETYQHYFHHFALAQKSRKIVDYQVDMLKVNTKWKYEEFLHAKVARDIPQVREFQQRLKSGNKGYHNTNQPYAARELTTQPGVDAECCVIL